MTEPTITCPNCRCEIKLNEQLAAPLVESTRRHYEELLTKKNQEFTSREQALRTKEDEVQKARESIESNIAERLTQERTRIAADEARKAKLLTTAELEQRANELANLQEVLKERDAKLAEAQRTQTELLRKQRELDDAKRELDLTVEKKIQEGLSTARDQVKRETEEAMRLRVSEKEQVIAAMQRQIEELRRRAEQGSQQLQGEVQELELEALLRTKFPSDLIEPVAKGEHGGDALHSVNAVNGSCCGKILWESKRTKSWQEGWLSKLRDDQRAANAEFAVIISQVLPKGIDSFDHIDGIWVTHPRYALPVATALRHALMELALARQSSEGQQTKMELIYSYLTGSQFRRRVEAIVEAFTTMRNDLDKERKAIVKQWAKREAQIDRVLYATSGMMGDLQGIAGKSIPEIEILSLSALNPPDEIGVEEELSLRDTEMIRAGLK